MDKILVAIAGGVPYDVVSTGFYSPYEEGGTGLLAPLDDYLAEWEHTNRFPPGLWESLKWQGKSYVVPQDSAVRGIGYNKILFAEAGLDPESPPKSWDDLLRYSRLLTRTENGQVSVRGYVNQPTTSGAAQELFWYMRQNGMTEIDVESLTSNLNRRETLDALNILVELAEANHFTSPILSGGFAAGRIAMDRHFPSVQQRLFRENPELIEAYGLFLPQKEPDAVPVAHGFIHGLAITQLSENKDLAWAFIDALYEEETLYRIEEISGFLSGHLDMVERHMGTRPKIELFYEIFTYLQASIIPPPRNIAQNELGQLILQVYRRQMPPLNALEHAHNIWSNLLAEWRETLQ